MPIIGLPLFEDCFSSLNEAKMAQPSQWAAKIQGHYSLECYLDKRGLAQELLDPDVLRGRLSQLRSADQQPPIPSRSLPRFTTTSNPKERGIPRRRICCSNSIGTTRRTALSGRRRPQPKTLRNGRAVLWRQKRHSTSDDELVIQALTKIARKPGSASDEFREFFERRSERWRRIRHSIWNGRTSFTARRSNVLTFFRAFSSACSARSEGLSRSKRPMSSLKADSKRSRTASSR